jgi:hypothetical protein
MTKQELAKAIVWMMDKGYATGHGDTVVDLLQELEWQVAEREREACAKVAESYEPTCDSCPSGAAIAIRSRGIDGARVGEVGVWGEKPPVKTYCGASLTTAPRKSPLKYPVSWATDEERFSVKEKNT